MARVRIDGNGYVLGHGVLINPVSVRRDGSYAFVGLVDELTSQDWLNIQPCDDDDGWLEEQGPGILVFIPDEETHD